MKKKLYLIIITMCNIANTSLPKYKNLNSEFLDWSTYSPSLSAKPRRKKRNKKIEKTAIKPLKNTETKTTINSQKTEEHKDQLNKLGIKAPSQTQYQHIKNLSFYNFFHIYYPQFCQYLKDNHGSAESKQNISNLLTNYCKNAPYIIWLQLHKTPENAPKIDVFINDLLTKITRNSLITNKELKLFILQKSCKKNSLIYDYSKEELLGSIVDGNSAKIANLSNNLYNEDLFTYPMIKENAPIDQKNADYILKSIILEQFKKEIFYPLSNYKNQEHIVFAKENTQKKEIFDTNGISIDQFYNKLPIQNGPYCALFVTFIMSLMKILGSCEDAIKVCIEMSQIYNGDDQMQISNLKNMITNVFKFSNLSDESKQKLILNCNFLIKNAKPITQDKYYKQKSLGILIRECLLNAGLTKCQSVEIMYVEDTFYQIQDRNRLFTGAIESINKEVVFLKNMNPENQNKLWHNFVQDMQKILPKVNNFILIFQQTQKAIFKKSGINVSSMKAIEKRKMLSKLWAKYPQEEKKVLDAYNELINSQNLNNPNLINDIISYTTNSRYSHLRILGQSQSANYKFILDNTKLQDVINILSKIIAKKEFFVCFNSSTIIKHWTNEKIV